MMESINDLAYFIRAARYVDEEKTTVFSGNGTVPFPHSIHVESKQKVKHDIDHLQLKDCQGSTETAEGAWLQQHEKHSGLQNPFEYRVGSLIHCVCV
jgi:hypothetical protein